MVAVNRPDWWPGISAVQVLSMWGYWHGCSLCKICTTVHMSNLLSLVHNSGVPVLAVDSVVNASSVVPVVGVVSVRLQ